jgi:lactate/malate dehydrogenase, NAD binding domain
MTVRQLPVGQAVGTSKIAIVGAGHVGVTLAYACLIRGTGKTIALYGRNAGKIRAEVNDLQQGLQFVPMATVEGPDDIEVCSGADVVVLTVGLPLKPGQSRLDLAADRVAICQQLLPAQPRRASAGRERRLISHRPIGGGSTDRLIHANPGGRRRARRGRACITGVSRR